MLNFFRKDKKLIEQAQAIKDAADKYAEEVKKQAAIEYDRIVGLAEDAHDSILQEAQEIHNRLIDSASRDDKRRIRETNAICAQKRIEAEERAKEIVADAQDKAQLMMVRAVSLGGKLTAEVYDKDIKGRVFFRIAPHLDAEGYEKLKAGEGHMSCKLIYPDGSRQDVQLIKYKG